jgi:hypothetical protein
MFSSAGCFLLRAEGFLCSLDVFYGGLWIGKLQFLNKKYRYIKKFSAVKFSIFGHQNTGKVYNNKYTHLAERNFSFMLSQVMDLQSLSPLYQRWRAGKNTACC